MKTVQQRIKTLNIIKNELNNKLIDIENGETNRFINEYNEYYEQYIKICNKIEDLKALNKGDL